MVVQDELTMEPWREALLGRLRCYAERWPEERATAAEFIRFVETEPDCLRRACRFGHLTGSAWIVDVPRRQALLVHHRKLGRWLQPGGHADGDGDLAAVARREAEEETGLRRLAQVGDGIFDLDRHLIPGRGDVPAHWHYDVRVLFEADPAEPLVVSDESHAVAWVEWPRAVELNGEESIRRMVRKSAV